MAAGGAKMRGSLDNPPQRRPSLFVVPRHPCLAVVPTLCAAALAVGLMPSPAAAEGIRFRDAAERWGLVFRHHHGGSGERFMVETVVGGVALFDFDGDGDLDVFFVDGGALPGYEGEAPRSRLFRNDGGRFVDRTAESGIVVAAYGSGAVAGDVDGDGDLDLYVTAFGPNQLFENLGDGTFRDATAAAGMGDPAWSASAVFSDVDRDGDLDLYVADYVDFTLATHKFCGDEARGIQAYCHPDAYGDLPDRLYLNAGDGTFRDATAAAGLGGVRGASLGVVAGDLTGDGWPDLYVANDADPNFLFVNRGDGTFDDRSLLSGTAYGDRGQAEGGMGVALGDADGDLLPDLVVTNFELETNAFYRNTGAGLFVDARYPAKLAESTLLKLAFGVGFGDFDQDGDLDLVVANGHILDNAPAINPRSRYPQPNQLFENLSADGERGRFREVAASGMDAVRVSRGLAVGDLDGDGDLDLVIVDSNDLAEVYENVSEGEGGWLQVDLVGAKSNRSGIGARLEIASTEGATEVAGTSREAIGASEGQPLGAVKAQVREVQAGGSYLSHPAITAHFGLRTAEIVSRLAIDWPSGKRQVLHDLPAGHRVRVLENE